MKIEPKTPCPGCGNMPHVFMHAHGCVVKCVTAECPRRIKRIGDTLEESIETWEKTANRSEAPPPRTVFESGAHRDAVDYRYDLCSPLAVMALLDDMCDTTCLNQAYRNLMNTLLDVENRREHLFVDLVTFVKYSNNFDVDYISLAFILEAYARAMHEGASKYGERNWEKGIPEENLVNHAINHLVKLIAGDTTEPHLDHLIWNVMTIIHFREKDKME